MTDDSHAGLGPITRADVSISKGLRRRHHFPGIAALPDGTLVVAARSSYEHIDPHGRIEIMLSRDEGASWTRPRTIINTTGDDRDPMVSVIDEELFLLWFTRRMFPDGTAVAHTFASRSSDAGKTWSEHVQVEVPGVPWVASHGPIVPAPDGALLAPVYTNGRSFVVRSTDGGRTFPAHHAVELHGGIPTNEVTLIPLPDGTVVAWLRAATEGERSVLMRSADGGQSWSDPERFAIRQSSAAGISLRDGQVLLAWGDLSGRFGHRRVTCAGIIDPAEWPWRAPEPIPVWDALNFDQANPAVAQLRDGSVFLVANDYASRQLVGKHLSLSALEPAPRPAQDSPALLDVPRMLQDGHATLRSNLQHPVFALSPELGLRNAAVGVEGQRLGEIELRFDEPQRVHSIGVALRPGENQSATVEVLDEDGWRLVGSLAEEWRYGGPDWFAIDAPITSVRVRTKLSTRPRPPKSRNAPPPAISAVWLRS